MYLSALSLYLYLHQGNPLNHALSTHPSHVGDLCFPGTESGRIAAKYKIPVILTANNPDLNSTDYKSPASQNTSFLLNGKKLC